MTACETLVECDWLYAALRRPDVSIIDASWHLPAQGRDAAAEYLAGHIPGAIPLDIDVVAARVPGPPGRMMPPAAQLASQLGALGLDPAAHLVVYDSVGLYSAARVWWMLRSHGHAHISVLNGGLPAWIRAGYPMQSGPAPARAATSWPVRPMDDSARDWRDVLENIRTRAELLVDVRPAAAFDGDTSNLYPGVRPGHIPGAMNLSQRDLLGPDGRMRAPGDIVAILDGAGLTPDRAVIATCGSGVTANVLALAMEYAGRRRCAIYDGSWEEWGSRPDLPAEIGNVVIGGGV